jgi:hypothetical protein
LQPNVDALANPVFTFTAINVKIYLSHGGELASTLEAEVVWQAEALNRVKMSKAINANNNNTALAYAA